jgi:hypothetical protein
MSSTNSENSKIEYLIFVVEVSDENSTINEHPSSDNSNSQSSSISEDGNKKIFIIEFFFILL